MRCAGRGARSRDDRAGRTRTRHWLSINSLGALYRPVAPHCRRRGPRPVEASRGPSPNPMPCNPPLPPAHRDGRGREGWPTADCRHESTTHTVPPQWLPLPALPAKPSRATPGRYKARCCRGNDEKLRAVPRVPTSSHLLNLGSKFHRSLGGWQAVRGDLGEHGKRLSASEASRAGRGRPWPVIRGATHATGGARDLRPGPGRQMVSDSVCATLPAGESIWRVKLS